MLDLDYRAGTSDRVGSCGANSSVGRADVERSMATCSMAYDCRLHERPL
jgi:hypothetical protein